MSRKRLRVPLMCTWGTWTAKVIYDAGAGSGAGGDRGLGTVQGLELALEQVKVLGTGAIPCRKRETSGIGA